MNTQEKLIFVCCKVDQIDGREKHLGIMSEKSMKSCRNPYWDYTKKMLVPKDKLENLHIGNVGVYLSLYQVH